MSQKSNNLPAAAIRALEEAEERRKLQQPEDENDIGKGESGGPRGEEPTRFGDWERKGIAYDF